MAGDVPDWVRLTEGETVVWTGGPSTVRVTEELLGEILLVGVGIGLLAAPFDEIVPADVPYLDLLPLVLVALGLVLGIVTYLRFRAITYLITTEELYVKRGLVSRTVRNLRLGRIQDCGFSQSALQRILGYGDVHVSTAGGGGVELVFRHVSNPAEVNGIITERLDDVRPEA